MQELESETLKVREETKAREKIETIRYESWTRYIFFFTSNTEMVPYVDVTYKEFYTKTTEESRAIAI